MKYKSCPPSCVLTLGKQIALVNHPFFLGFTGTTWILFASFTPPAVSLPVGSVYLLFLCVEPLPSLSQLSDSSGVTRGGLWTSNLPWLLIWRREKEGTSPLPLAHSTVSKLLLCLMSHITSHVMSLPWQAVLSPPCKKGGYLVSALVLIVFLFSSNLSTSVFFLALALLARSLVIWVLLFSGQVYQMRYMIYFWETVCSVFPVSVLHLIWCPLLSSPFILTHFTCPYLFLVALGLRCCMWAFSSCIEQGLLSSCGAWASRCSGFSCWGAWALENRLSIFGAQA